MYSTQTRTNTFTVTDIKKTFEGCEADIRAIARRTDKWDVSYVDKVVHDILLLAEGGYLQSVSITLIDTNDSPVRAAKFIVNTDGFATSMDRPGKNSDWPNLPNTELTIILSYTNDWRNLDDTKKSTINRSLVCTWSSTKINNDFPNLSATTQSQLYASKGYELQKMDYR